MIVADFEVFCEDWVLYGLDLANQKEILIHNNKEELEKVHKDYKNDIWVFYNGRNYDQYIFKAILCGFDPKEVNDFIILEGRKGYEFSNLFNNVPLTMFDIMPNPPVGLKTLEGFMGSDIRETTVSFDIDRKLTPEELEEVIFYCKHDVEQTALVLTKRIEEFTSQLELVKMFNMPRGDMGRTKAQLSAKALGAVRPFKSRKDELNFSIPETLRIKKYKHVVDWFIECRERALWNVSQGIELNSLLKDFYSQKLECDIAGVPHVFAWGGIHGAIPNYCEKGYFVNVDVASYYPSLMIEYDYISRNIKDPSHYKDMYKTRLAYKAKKDKRANPLKIVLNSTYGAMKDRFNPLYDPLQANNVCVAGQLLLLDLIEHLEPYVDIVQSNTDGILVKLRASNEREATREFERLDDLCYEWEKRSRMTLEFDEFRKVIQRDVNNYIIVASDGSHKSKGGVVKKLNDLDYDLPIVNRAVVASLVKDVTVTQTVNECDDLRDFQKIVKVSSKYAFATHNGEQLTEKTFRVFASNRDTDGKICKCKTVGATEEKFANTPDRCFIDNSEVRGKALPSYLDKQYYIDLAEKRVKEFLGL